MELVEQFSLGVTPCHRPMAQAGMQHERVRNRHDFEVGPFVGRDLHHSHCRHCHRVAVGHTVEDRPYGAFGQCQPELAAERAGVDAMPHPAG